MSGIAEGYLLDTNIFIYFFNGETAVENNLTLVTRNVDDFQAIQGLTVFNPFSV